MAKFRVLAVVISIILIVQKATSVETSKAKLLTPEQGCGRTPIQKTRIIGGSTAAIGSYPWMALIGYGSHEEGIQFNCGGSLITLKHVLTAAHCINWNLYLVRLAEHYKTTTSDGPTQDIIVSSVARHSQYVRRFIRNDIAILTLEKHVKLSNRVTPICLPLDDNMRKQDLVGQKPILAGWGRIKAGGDASTVLKEVQIPVHNGSVCQNIFGPQLFNDSEQVCAGILGGTDGSCQGDSGGPLMLSKSSSLFYQIGLVSYGAQGCVAKGMPTVFTDVRSYMDWIQWIIDG